MADDEENIEFENLNEIFQGATEYVRKYNSKFDTEKLLYFYSRFKQAKDGKCNTPKPGFFDFQGKSKWESWNKLGGMSRQQAMMEYVSLLTNIDQDWQTQLSSSAEGSPGGDRVQGMGVAVSIMARTEDDLAEGDKTAFDWCKEGDVDRVRVAVGRDASLVNTLDSEGLGLLHWASDRGLDEMVQLLLSHGVDINHKDIDGQTALHYAISCGHPDLVSLLVTRGIDQSARDSEGNLASDMASDDIKLLLKQLAATTTTSPGT